MACKIKEEHVIGGGGVPSGGGITLPDTTKQPGFESTYIPDLPTVKEGMLNFAKQSKIGIGKFPLSLREFKISDRSLAVGKRIIVLNSEIYGPTEKERIDGVEISKNNNDNLRIESKRYWTRDNSGRYLVYLKDVGAIPSFEFVDFNFANSEAIKVSNFPIISVTNFKNKGDIKRISIPFPSFNPNSIQRIINNKDNVFYGTSQWVLIQNTKAFFNMIEKTNNIVPNMKLNNLPQGYNIPIVKQAIWKKYVQGGQSQNNTLVLPLIEKNKTFFDYAFQLDLPFSKKELEKFAGVNNPLVTDIKMDYNFLVQNYENTIKEVDEILLPNMYIIQSEIRDDVMSSGQGKINANTYFDKIITLNGHLDPSPFKLKEVEEKNRGSKFRRDNQRGKTARPTFEKIADINAIDMVGEYFDNYALRMRDLVTVIPGDFLEDINRDRARRDSISELYKLGEKVRRIGIPISNMGILNEFYDKKEMYPMFVDIQFSTDKTTQLAQILKDSQLSSNFIFNMMRSDISNSGFEKKKFVEAIEYIEEVKNEIGGVQLNKKFTFQTNERRTWNITKWLKNFDEKDIVSSEISSIQEDIGLFLDKETDEVVMQSNNPSYVFFRNLLEVIFIGKLKKLIKDKFRTYEEMMNGKLAYSETVLYRVERKLVNSVSTINPFFAPQNYYFPNANEIDVLKFVDTQVKYGVPYVYSIYAYQAVIGTQYSYDNVVMGDRITSFQVTQEPSILLVEVPYYQFKGAIVDDPPICPDVDIIPYKGVNNELLMFFNGGIGDVYLDPIIIEPQEQADISLFRKIKGYDLNEKIRYKADDFTGVFQVYRIEEHPSSYSDFARNLLVAVESDIDRRTPQGATAASYKDKIKPNKKYWYCFRAVDYHGHMSNPSPVFQVQMIDNSGVIYPLIEVVDFIDKKQKKLTKNMRRFMYIKPKFAQTLINEAKSGIENVESVKDINNVFLGVNEQTVFGKDYLIRLTSKQTGKIVEFVVNFDHRFNRKR
jgi:hypothetical protein